MLDYRLKQSKKFLKTQNRKQGIGRRIGWPLMACACLALALLFLMLYSLFWHRSGQNGGGIGHDDYIVFLPKQEEENANLIVQEIICPKAAEMCFKVEDYLTASGRRYQRHMMVEGVDDVVLSVADLVPNPGEHFSAENAKRWSVLKTRLVLPYTKGVIAQMFATGCLQLDRKSRTLMVGLGGAALSNFIGEMDGQHEVVSIELEPAVEYIAHKWFGLEKSAKQKVVIQDGIEFINQWQSKSGQFDCIILDACNNKLAADSKYPLICPIQEMVNNEEFVKKMLSMLTANGALLINTFTVEDESNMETVAEERQFILELFRHHFAHCYYADLVHNKVLTCTRGKEPMTNKKYEEQMKRLPNWLQNELKVRVNILDNVWKPQRTEI